MRLLSFELLALNFKLSSALAIVIYLTRNLTLPVPVNHSVDLHPSHFGGSELLPSITAHFPRRVETFSFDEIIAPSTRIVPRFCRESRHWTGRRKFMNKEERTDALYVIRKTES
ncbi:hypothetical protein NPIL_547231 [Nephila pilipes]|uniref:Uncharacterized protein n=1 Tax=Nephila pilipes TaxID=299642 RepID=A0A8X6ILR5_NEPPI|nr:hypothetical protein NPIL_547231 [Nephila pilipes]